MLLSISWLLCVIVFCNFITQSTFAQFVNLIFHVQEHILPGQVIGNIFQTSKFDYSNNTITIESPLDYWSLFFTICTKSGIIRSGSASQIMLDREKICPLDFKRYIKQLPKLDRQECKVSILLSINHKILVTLSIVIEDINDNEPHFFDNGSLNSTLTLYFPENAIVNKTKVQLPIVLDLDSSSNQNIHLHIISDNVPFFIQQANFSVNILHSFLCINKPLDYETQSSYSFSVKACDDNFSNVGDATEAFECSLTLVEVKVINVNDNKPYFLNDTYTAIVKEDALVGTLILTVQAFDADLPPFGNISYYIHSQSKNIPFIINSKSGEIFLNSNGLIYKQYTFYIKVKDTPNEKNSFELNFDKPEEMGLGNLATTFVTVFVIDTNNQHPLISFQRRRNSTIDFLTKLINFKDNIDEKPFIVELEEETVELTILSYLTITDLDEGDNSQCTCKLNNNKESPFISKFELIKVNQISHQVVIYRLAAVAPIDAENERIKNSMISPEIADVCNGVAGFILIDITCSDSGQEPLLTEKSLYVALMDINEFPMFFDLPHMLDSSILLEMEANSKLFRIFLKENTPIYTNLMILRINDADTTQCIRFSLDNKVNKSGYISLDPQTGIIRLTRELDFETTKKLSFKLRAAPLRILEDKDSEVVAYLHINILNINDNHPIIIFPHKTDKTTCISLKSSIALIRPVFFNLSISSNNWDCVTMEIQEELPFGTIIGKIAVKDIDLLNNTDFSFTYLDSFVPKFTNLFYKMTHFSRHMLILDNFGELRVSGRIDREEVKWIDLVFSITDNGIPPQVGLAILHLTLVDINDNPPKWQFPVPTDYKAVIHASTEIGSVISRVQALDADCSTVNGEINYSIAPQPLKLSADNFSSHYKNDVEAAHYAARYFQIDAKTGKLYNLQKLLNYSHVYLRLDLIAKDSGTPQLSSQTHLIISVTFDQFKDMPVNNVRHYVQNDGTYLSNQGHLNEAETTSDFDPTKNTYIMDNIFQLALVVSCVFLCLVFILTIAIIWCRRAKRRRIASKLRNMEKLNSNQKVQEIEISSLKLNDNDTLDFQVETSQIKSSPVFFLNQSTCQHLLPPVNLPENKLSHNLSNISSMPVFVGITLQPEANKQHKISSQSSEFMLVGEVKSFPSSSANNDHLFVAEANINLD